MASQIASRLMADLQRDFGLTHNQAAGFVGNLAHESGNFQTLQERGVKQGRGGFGYAQWTGPRRRQFEKFASDSGLDPTSYEANYGFIKQELEGPEKRVLKDLRNSTTAEQAARIVSNQYERPGVPRMASRIEHATQLAGSAPDTATAAIQQVAPTPQDRPSALAFNGTQGPTSNAPVPASVQDRILARTFGQLQQQPQTTQLDPSIPIPASAEDKVIARTFGQLNPNQTSSPNLQAPIPASADDMMVARTSAENLRRQNPAPIPAPRIPDAMRNAGLIAQLPQTSALAQTAPHPQDTITRDERVWDPMFDRHGPFREIFRGGSLLPQTASPSLQVPTPASADARLAARTNPDILRQQQPVPPPQQTSAIDQVAPIPQTRPVFPPTPAVRTSAPIPADRIQRKGMLDLGGIRLPGMLGLVQNIDRAAANASGTFGNNFDNLVQQTMTRNRNVRKPDEPQRFVRTARGVEEVGSRRGTRGRTVSQNPFFNRITGLDV